MKIAGAADLHLSLYGQDPVCQESGLPERLHFIIQSMKHMVGWLRTNGINKLFLAGDINHNKSIIHTLAFAVFIDFIRENKDITFIIIDGNHDMSSKSGRGASSLKGLDKEENVMMIHKTTLIENILYVPWGPTMIDDIKNGSADYLVSHLGLNEAQLSSGISIVSDIGLKDLKQYKRAFLGHYHKPQELGNMISIGSTTQLDWGEKGEEKRFIVLDTKTDDLTFVPTEGYSKYIEFDVSSANKDTVFEEAKKLQDEGHHIKINRVEKINLGDEAKDFHVIDKVDVDITNRGMNTSMTDEEKLNRYMDIKEVSDDKREMLLNTGIELLDEVRS